MRSSRWVWAGIVLFTLCSCGITPAGERSETGFSVQGFVGHSPTVPAPLLPVALLDGATGAPLATTKTNLFGKYSFSGLRPGLYRVQAEKVERKVAVANQGVRLDIDLSAKDGVMNYAAGAAAASSPAAPAPASSGKGAGGAVPQPAGPNNPQLQGQIAGVWWGYSGSTERKIGLCPDGSYRDFTESSYSGRFTDSGGYQTGAWGTAGQRSGAGRWTIEGNTQSGAIRVVYSNGGTAVIRYRQVGEAGCLDFNGNRLCRTSATCE